jgi:hypothetical protein
MDGTRMAPRVVVMMHRPGTKLVHVWQKTAIIDIGIDIVLSQVNNQPSNFSKGSFDSVVWDRCIKRYTVFAHLAFSINFSESVFMQ